MLKIEEKFDLINWKLGVHLMCDAQNWCISREGAGVRFKTIDAKNFFPKKAEMNFSKFLQFNTPYIVSILHMSTLAQFTII